MPDIIGPLAGAEPIFVVVIGTLLVCPTVKGVEGCPIVVVKSGTPATGVAGEVGVALLFVVLFTGSFGADEVPDRKSVV